MYDLGSYTQEHRRELERLAESQAWQMAVGSGLVEEVKAGRIEPGKTRSSGGTTFKKDRLFGRKNATFGW